MSTTTQGALGTVVSVLRYPVKSMLGEELNSAWVTSCGVLGDRAFALVSATDGKVISAKNPRTLAQADLPADPQILRTAARQNKAHVGVYASVVQSGLIRRGDVVRIAE